MLQFKHETWLYDTVGKKDVPETTLIPDRTQSGYSPNSTHHMTGSNQVLPTQITSVY